MSLKRSHPEEKEEDAEQIQQRKDEHNERIRYLREIHNKQHIDQIKLTEQIRLREESARQKRELEKKENERIKRIRKILYPNGSDVWMDLVLIMLRNID